MTLKLPSSIQIALTTLHQSGFEAYLVGGCVRDYIMKRPIHDYDVTTSALPEETKQVFQNYAVHETGIKHGTVLVVIDHTPIEITTYRYEGSYQDHRHPDEVHFTRNLQEDLKRRDFTMNALVFSNQVLDYFGGVTDIESKTIRAIGNPLERFDEDALRIMRGLRFASQLGFQIEENTFQAMISQRELLSVISKERITDEFLKYLEGTYLLETRKYADALLPTLFSDYPQDSKTLFQDLSQTNNLLIRLTLFFQSTSFSNVLILPNKTKVSIHSLNSYLHSPPQSKYELKCMLRKIGEELTLTLLDYYATIYPKQSENLNKDYQIICTNQEIYSLDKLAIKGNQLIQLGYQGKAISDTLELLLEAVMHEKVSNTYEMLIAYLTKK